MQWSDRGIVLSVRRLGESSGVVHLLTLGQGLHAGVDRGAFGKRRRGVYQPGNSVMAHWQARLPDHLGMFSCELIEANAARLLQDRRKLAALNSATLLTEKTLAEREAQPTVFESLETLLRALCTDEDWPAAYVRFELHLLACSGFGLDLGRCASTGQMHDLMYVSPKSGRAVSRGAGAPYHERLLRLPPFLLESAASPPQAAAFFSTAMPHILDGLRLCGYFLGCRVFAPRGIGLPAARARLIEALHAGEVLPA